MYSKEQQQELHRLSQEILKAETFFSDAEKISVLKKIINSHDWRYYVLSEPIILDVDYINYQINLKLNLYLFL